MLTPCYGARNISLSIMRRSASSMKFGIRYLGPIDAANIAHVMGQFAMLKHLISLCYSMCSEEGCRLCTCGKHLHLSRIGYV